MLQKHRRRLRRDATTGRFVEWVRCRLDAHPRPTKKSPAIAAYKYENVADSLLSLPAHSFPIPSSAHSFHQEKNRNSAVADGGENSAFPSSSISSSSSTTTTSATDTGARRIRARHHPQTRRDINNLERRRGIWLRTINLPRGLILEFVAKGSRTSTWRWWTNSGWLIIKMITTAAVEEGGN